LTHKEQTFLRAAAQKSQISKKYIFPINKLSMKLNIHNVIYSTKIILSIQSLKR